MGLGRLVLGVLGSTVNRRRSYSALAQRKKCFIDHNDGTARSCIVTSRAFIPLFQPFSSWDMHFMGSTATAHRACARNEYLRRKAEASSGRGDRHLNLMLRPLSCPVVWHAGVSGYAIRPRVRNSQPVKRPTNQPNYHDRRTNYSTREILR